MCVGGTHPNPSHAWGQGSLESFQPRRSCPGRNTEVSPLMCAGKTRLASSQRQGSQSLASSAALPGKAASPTGPQHVEPEPPLPRRVISTGCLRSGGRAAASWPAGWRPRTVPEARVPPGLRPPAPAQGLDHWPGRSGAGPGAPPPKEGLGRLGESSQEGQGGLLTFQSCFCS